jgi:hypothetical protein
MPEEAYYKAEMKEMQVYEWYKHFLWWLCKLSTINYQFCQMVKTLSVRNVMQRVLGSYQRKVGILVWSIQSILHKHLNMWFPLHDNAHTYQPLVVKKYFAKHNVTASEHPPYSPGLSQPDFLPVSVTKKCFRRMIHKHQGSYCKNEHWQRYQKMISRNASKSFTSVAKVCDCPWEIIWRKCCVKKRKSDLFLCKKISQELFEAICKTNSMWSIFERLLWNVEIDKP